MTCAHTCLGGERGGVWCRHCAKIWNSFGEAVDSIPEVERWRMEVGATYVASAGPLNPDEARLVSRVWLRAMRRVDDGTPG